MVQPLGEVDIEITPIGQPFFNATVENYFKQESSNISGIIGLSGRLQLAVTAFITSTGVTELDIPLVGVNSSEASFGTLYSLNTKEQLPVRQLKWNDTTKEAYIGSEVATALDIEVGDKFNVSFNVGIVTLQFELIAKDIYDKNEGLGQEGAGRRIYVPLAQLQNEIKPYTKTNVLSSVVINVEKSIENDREKIDAIVDKLKELADKNSAPTQQYGGSKGFHFATRRLDLLELSDSLFEAFNMILNVFGSLIVLAGIFLILNVQLMTLEEREKETGIRLAIGTKTTQVVLSNLAEFAGTGLIGGFLGLLGGIAYGYFLVQVLGWAFDFPVDKIALIVKPEFVIISFVSGFLLAVVVGVFPAIHASRLNVVRVMRGLLEEKDKKLGYKGLYLGAALLIIGIIFIFISKINPLDYPNSYKTADDAATLYIPMLLVILGATLVLSYYIPREVAYNALALGIIGQSLFNIFFVLNLFEERSSGFSGLIFFISITLSLTIGIIIFVGINLRSIATVLIKLFYFIGKFRAVALISFKQMASQRTRSTLTFAIFAVVLTLNVFMATWAYSDSQGFQRRAALLGADSDILLLTSNPIPQNLSFETKLKERFPAITDVFGFTASPQTEVVINKFNLSDPSYISRESIYPVDNTTFWSDYSKDRSIPLVLRTDKLKENDTVKIDYKEPFERGNASESTDPQNIAEDEIAWRALAENAKVNGKPVVIMRPALRFTAGRPTLLSDVGGSVWIKNKTGGYTEFIIIAILESNPLTSFRTASFSSGFRTGTAVFVNKEVAKDLAIFDTSQGGVDIESHNVWLLKTKYPLNSKENTVLAREIEKWVNAPAQTSSEKSFYDETHINYGALTKTVYDIFADQLEGHYRFFLFIQAFTSLGFVVGIIGLLVMAIRSVSSRKREIGMMRAIGYKKSEVILAVIFELVIVGILGLVIGIASGTILAWALIKLNSTGAVIFLIPWPDLALYTTITLGSAFIAAIIPGYIAARITPSDALRYIG